MRLHIVGCPRSGTTLMMELIATCFDVVRLARHEVSIFRTPELQGCSVGGGVFVSKQPTDILYMEKLLQHDENLHVLVMTRDPRAVITSVHHATDNFFVNYRIWQQCDDAARRLRPHPRVLQLRYEDLVSYPDIYQQIIQNTFGFLRQRYRFSRYHHHAVSDQEAVNAMNGLRAIDTKGINKWCTQLPRVKQQLQRHPQLQHALTYHGYETNADWQLQLVDVQAVQYGCRYPESPQPLKEWEKQVRVWFELRRYIRWVAATMLTETAAC